MGIYVFLVRGAATNEYSYVSVPLSVMHATNEYSYISVPLSVMHATAHETVLNGHRIPKGTWVFPMLYAVNENDKGWEDPDAFKPERFIDQNGECHRPDNLIPFGIGKNVPY